MISPPRTGRSSSPGWTTWRGWAEAALLLALVGSGFLLGAWKAGAAAVPGPHVLDADLRACIRRVALGYVSSGIEVSTEDALTIHAACERAVRGEPQGRESGR